MEAVDRTERLQSGMAHQVQAEDLGLIDLVAVHMTHTAACLEECSEEQTLEQML